MLSVVLEKTLESPLDSNKIKLFNPKGNQPWIFIGRRDPEGEVLILWPPEVKSQLIRKDPVLGKIKGRRKRGYRGWDNWMTLPTQSMDMSLRKLQEMLKDRDVWRAAVHGFAKIRTWLSNPISSPKKNGVIQV